MTLPIFAFFSALVIVTAFISGIFGMAGGVVLMGALLWILPVPTAMVLHGVTQAASNGSRAILWAKWIEWRIVLRYGTGLALACFAFGMIKFVPNEAMVLLFLGLLPWISYALPQNLSFDARGRFQAECCGFACTSLQLISGVSGTILDLYFARTDMDRRSVVATKGACQVITHISKIIYFGLIISTSVTLQWYIYPAAITLAILGTIMSGRLLEKMSDQNFRRFSRYIIFTLSFFYLAQGGAMLI